MNRRADFPLLVANPDIHYLDSAATSQKPRVVLDAMREFYETSYANPHRGAYSLSVAATDCYSGARERIARFLGAADADCLIFTRGTTESINLVASAWGRENVRRGDDIVVTALEHHANFVPWQQLAIERSAGFRICELTSDGRIDLDRLRALLTHRTRVVAFSHVSNALGTVNPVREIVEMCDGTPMRSLSSTVRKALRICAFDSTSSAWTSTRSADTRCAARWVLAGSLESARSWRTCLPTRRGET